MQSGEAGTVHRNLPDLTPESGGPGSECTQVRPGQSTTTSQNCYLSQEDLGQSSEAQSGKAGKSHLWREGQSLATFARVGSVDWGSGGWIMVGW